MKPVPQKFVRTLGVGLVGLLAFMLLVFFVATFFAQHSSVSRVSMYGNPMMGVDKSSVSATISASPMMNWDGARSGMMGKPQSFRVNMMEATPVQAVADRKVIKNGVLSVQVDSVDVAFAEMSKVATEMGGMVADSHVDQAIGDAKRGTLTVKVMVAKFDEALARLKALSVVVTSEDVSGSDVTGQVIDLQARINNQRAAEATLQSLFDRAVKISDVIEITDKLAAVRSDIESLEGQMRYLNSQTDMASITVFMTEDVQVATDKGFRPLQTLKESLVLLIGLFGDITQGLIRVLIVGMPVLLIDGAILWILYRVVRKAVIRFWPGSVPEKRRVVRKK